MQRLTKILNNPFRFQNVIFYLICLSYCVEMMFCYCKIVLVVHFVLNYPHLVKIYLNLFVFYFQVLTDWLTDWLTEIVFNCVIWLLFFHCSDLKFAYVFLTVSRVNCNMICYVYLFVCLFVCLFLLANWKIKKWNSNKHYWIQ